MTRPFDAPRATRRAVLAGFGALRAAPAALTPSGRSPYIGEPGEDIFGREVLALMLRLLLRFVGLLLLAGAFAALIVDATRSVAAGAPAIYPLGRTLSSLFPGDFLKAQAAIEAHAPLVWDPVLVSILLLPAWAVLGLGGIVILALARPPAPKIGYSRR